MKGIDVIVQALHNSADCMYAVPGYPVTDLSEACGAEVVLSEKVGIEYALGDSLSGKRAAVIMKNVGINACADPLIQATTQGLVGGVVLIAGDDVEAAGSQNAQDSRYYGELAQVPVIEPSPDTCGSGVEAAFRASEQFSRIAIIRLTPPLLSADVNPALPKRQQLEGRLADSGLTMRGRVMSAEIGMKEMFAWSRGSDLNHIAGDEPGAGAVGDGSRVVIVYPPPAGADHLARTREIGRPFVRDHRCVLPPAETLVPERLEQRGYFRTFCRGCPFYPVFDLLKERGLHVIADAGCSILTTNLPYQVGIACYGLGSSIGVAAKSTGIALIGDYALLHSGMVSLIDVYEKNLPLLCIVLKNRCLGMTGGQETPDPVKYIAWANPVVCAASDRSTLSKIITPSSYPLTVVVEGTCPEGRKHETVEY